MATSIELKEQMKMLKQQQRDAEKEQKKMKKDFEMWRRLLNEHQSFCDALNYRNKYNSFEQLIVNEKWTNRRMDKKEFEFLFTQLRYTDTEFFTTFMNWDSNMFSMPIEDRKCSVCLSYYTTAKTPQKFINCCHMVCNECYTQIAKKVDGYKCCVICRKSEKPLTTSSIHQSFGRPVSDLRRNLVVDISM